MEVIMGVVLSRAGLPARGGCEGASTDASTSGSGAVAGGDADEAEGESDEPGGGEGGEHGPGPFERRIRGGLPCASMGVVVYQYTMTRKRACVKNRSCAAGVGAEVVWPRPSVCVRQAR